MRDDEERVQVEADGEVAERGLCERPDEDPHGEPAREPRQSGDPERRQSRDQGRDDDDTADQPVAELDEGVDVVGRERLALVAAWP